MVLAVYEMATMWMSPKRRVGHGCASEAGVTLVEITVTLAVLLIGTMLAVPAYLQWTAKAELKQAATEVGSTMTLARVAAMSRNTTVTVSLAMEAGRIQVETGGLFPPSPMGRSITGFTPDPFTDVAFSSLGLRVLPIGNAPVLITLTNDHGLTFSVVVSSSGRVLWCARSMCP